MLDKSQESSNICESSSLLPKRVISLASGKQNIWLSIIICPWPYQHIKVHLAYLWPYQHIKVRAGLQVPRPFSHSTCYTFQCAQSISWPSSLPSYPSCNCSGLLLLPVSLCFSLFSILCWSPLAHSYPWPCPGCWPCPVYFFSLL